VVVLHAVRTYQEFVSIYLDVERKGWKMEGKGQEGKGEGTYTAQAIFTDPHSIYALPFACEIKPVFRTA
jgi:hypothetical protein